MYDEPFIRISDRSVTCVQCATNLQICHKISVAQETKIRCQSNYSMCIIAIVGKEFFSTLLSSRCKDVGGAVGRKFRFHGCEANGVIRSTVKRFV